MAKLGVPAALAALAVGTGCGDAANGDPGAGAPDLRADPPAELWGRTFKSTAITKDGEPRPLVPGTRLKARFEKSGERRSIGWSAGCNDFGARLRFGSGRLRVGRIVQTLIACPPDLARQDAWVARFFGSDPKWRLTGRRLVLKSRARVIEMRAVRRRR